MNSNEMDVEMRKLTAAQKREIENRKLKYRDDLASRGYSSQALVDESGVFGLVLVEDPQSQRRGLLLGDGSIRWMDEALGPGGLADGAVSGVTVDGTPL